MAKKRGRPKLPANERKAVTLNIKMSPSLHQALFDAAAAKGLTASDLVREAIEAIAVSEAKGGVGGPKEVMLRICVSESMRKALFRAADAAGSSASEIVRQQVIKLYLT